MHRRLNNQPNKEANEQTDKQKITKSAQTMKYSIKQTESEQTNKNNEKSHKQTVK